jgi:hypothetical protein
MRIMITMPAERVMAAARLICMYCLNLEEKEKTMTARCPDDHA